MERSNLRESGGGAQKSELWTQHAEPSPRSWLSLEPSLPSLDVPFPKPSRSSVLPANGSQSHLRSCPGDKAKSKARKQAYLASPWTWQQKAVSEYLRAGSLLSTCPGPGELPLWPGA